MIDATTKLTKHDTGGPNHHIPAAGTAGREDECPPVFYGKAFHRDLTYLWNLRIEFPADDLLQDCSDDVNSAFRRVLYHPDVAAAFSCVFLYFLIIPVGMIFGARNSPSFFCRLAELKAHLGAVGNYKERPVYQIVVETTLVAPPPREFTFAQAAPDSQHQGLTTAADDREHHVMFVDDNVCAATRECKHATMQAAAGSACDIFGAPEDDRRPDCLREDKWDPVASNHAPGITKYLHAHHGGGVASGKTTGTA
jgi:hypothetical protein